MIAGAQCAESQATIRKRRATPEKLRIINI
jgi:hypothetical protein